MYRQTTNWMGKHRDGWTDGLTVSIHCKYHQTVAVILPVTLIDNPAGLSQVSVLLQVCEGGVRPRLHSLRFAVNY